MSKRIAYDYEAELKRIGAYLNNLVERARKEYPEANLYLAADDLCLMSGPSHDERCKPRQDRILARVRLPGSGGGDW